MRELISFRLRVAFPCLVAFGGWAMACGRTEQGRPDDGLGGQGGAPDANPSGGGKFSGGAGSAMGGENMGGVPSGTGGGNSGGMAPSGSGGSFIGPDGRCVPGSYRASPLLEPLACSPWTNCHPGEKVTRIGTRTEDRLCEPCEDESFSVGENTPSCTPIKACAFDEELATPGTKTTNAVCEPSGLFTGVPVGSSGEVIGMTATDEGVYVLVGDPFPSKGARILRYSVSGEPLEDISLGTGIVDAQSITSIGSDVYISGTIEDEGPDPIPGAFVRCLDKTGALLWEERFDDQAIFGRVATDRTSLFLASDGHFPGELHCNDPAYPEYCFQGVNHALVLRRFDRDGTLRAEQILTDESGGSVWVTDLAVTGTGDAFIMGSGDHLFPDANVFVAEFDANLDLVHVHATDTLGCSPCLSLAGDEGEQVSVFGRYEDLAAADFSVARLESGGVLDSIIAVDVNGNNLKAIATAPDVLYLGGETFLSEASLFLRLEPDGTLIDEQTHSARIRQAVTAIALTPDGKAYAAGVGQDSGRKIFVTPWLSSDSP